MNAFYVLIIEHGTSKIEACMGPDSHINAEKRDTGANRNLNHTRFYTLIVPANDPRVHATTVE